MPDGAEATVLPGGWAAEVVAGRAQALHDAAVPEVPLLRLHEVTAPAVVLGSTQGDDVDVALAAASGVDVARRRSGGGAVWLAPGAQVWVDVVVPRGHPAWRDDVDHAAAVVGRAWAALAVELGAGDVAVHAGGLADRAAGRVACFAALGPGEVATGGHKLVGISQRRRRGQARLQCVAYLVDAPGPLASLLVPAARSVPGVVPGLARTAALPTPPAGWSVVERLAAHLPPV